VNPETHQHITEQLTESVDELRKAVNALTTKVALDYHRLNSIERVLWAIAVAVIGSLVAAVLSVVGIM
jgi:hypothetical protein